MQARLQNPPKLPIFGKGRNRIPTVHVADLVTYIEKIVERKPNLPYLLALDHNPKPTQRKIIESISKGIGTGLVESVPENSKDVPFHGELTLNLRMRPSMVFAKIEEEEAAIEAEEGTEPVRFKFPWRAKEGIQKGIEQLRQEFNRVEGLSQVKVFLIGPPGSGKTHFASMYCSFDSDWLRSTTSRIFMFVVSLIRRVPLRMNSVMKSAISWLKRRRVKCRPSRLSTMSSSNVSRRSPKN